jgi:hypothetical protein
MTASRVSIGGYVGLTEPDLHPTKDMRRSVALLLVALFLFLHPLPAHAQCKEALCSNLQNIVDAASIDFRGYTARTVTLPEVSTESTKVPCSMSTWANNVPMVICYAKVPLGNATNWFARAMDALKLIDSSWHFMIRTPGDDRYVDAGPPDCRPTPTEGPYIGQCPLRLEVTKQADGSANLYLMMNSLSSPYLLHQSSMSPTPAKPAAPAVSVGSGCDEFCQNLKKAFEARANAFADAPPAKLTGAKDCLVNAANVPPTLGAATQFVCYWQESSASAADARFRDLVARLQVLVPSNWSTRQENELDEQTGASLTAWHAVEPGYKHDVRVYLSGDSVGLHITAAK